MKLNFKNLSDSIKRINLIPRAGAEASANIGVDNPTLDISEYGVVSFCLAPAQTDTIFISLFDELRVSGDGWSFETNAANEEELRNTLNSHGFAIQDSGDFMVCGDIYRIINMNPTQQRLKFESLNGSNNIEVLPQPNTAWSFNELPSSSDQELNVCLAPNATAVPIQGMQATPIMPLFIPTGNIEGDMSVNLLRFFVNDVAIYNPVLGGYNFIAANSIHNTEVNDNLRLSFFLALPPYGVLVDTSVSYNSYAFSTEQDAYKIVRIECDNKLRDDSISKSHASYYFNDSNNRFNIIHNTDELGYKAEFCIVNPQLPEGYPA